MSTSSPRVVVPESAPLRGRWWLSAILAPIMLFLVWTLRDRADETGRAQSTIRSDHEACRVLAETDVSRSSMPFVELGMVRSYLIQESRNAEVRQIMGPGPRAKLGWEEPIVAWCKQQFPDDAAIQNGSFSLILPRENFTPPAT